MTNELIGCDGPCVVITAWCPDCDRATKHVLISQTCRECCECGELSADLTQHLTTEAAEKARAR